MEKIIVAFESEKTALRVKELLEGGGAAACLVCRTADQVRRAINKLPVPAVVCGYKLGDQTAELFFEDLPPLLRHAGAGSPGPIGSSGE